MSTQAQEKNDWPKDAAYKITIDGTNLACYLKHPKMDTYRFFLKLTTGKDPDYIQAGELLLNDTWVGGDEQIKTNETYRLAACMKAFEIIEIKAATLEKR